MVNVRDDPSTSSSCRRHCWSDHCRKQLTTASQMNMAGTAGNNQHQKMRRNKPDLPPRTGSRRAGAIAPKTLTIDGSEHRMGSKTATAI
jgi:hypothetical protein